MRPVQTKSCCVWRFPTAPGLILGSAAVQLQIELLPSITGVRTVRLISVPDHERTSTAAAWMSVYPSKAEVARHRRHFRYVPSAEVRDRRQEAGVVLAHNRQLLCLAFEPQRIPQAPRLKSAERPILFLLQHRGRHQAHAGNPCGTGPKFGSRHPVLIPQAPGQQREHA